MATMIWFEPFIVFSILAAGAYVGHHLSDVKSKWWHLGYVIPLLVIWLLIAARLLPSISYQEPYSFVLQSRALWLRGFFVMILFCTLAPRLELERQKRAVYAFVVMMALFHLCPFLLPPLFVEQYSNLEDTWAVNNVCIQNTSQTCGPASAATALRALNIKASEAELATMARTSMIGGTMPWELAWAIECKFKKQGIACKVIHLSTIKELKNYIPFIATVYLSTFSDHYVTVLAVTDERVVIGCPLDGYKKLTHAEFEKVWRKGGIAVTKEK